MITVKKNEATAAYRRMYFHCVDATDGMTPETGEAGGQPQVSVNGDAFGTQAIIGVLVAIGNGRYYAELTQAGVNIADRSVIEGRYKSANTAEAVGTTIQIVEYPVDASVNTIAGYIDTEITAIINAITALQSDIGDPSADATTIYAQALLIKGYVDELEARLTAIRAGYLDNLSAGAVALNSTVAKEATLENATYGLSALKTLIDAIDTSTELQARFTEIKGAGWTTETLVAIKALIGQVPAAIIGATLNTGVLQSLVAISASEPLRVYRGDYLPAGTFTFSFGTAWDCSGGKKIYFCVKKSPDGPEKIDVECTITDAANAAGNVPAIDLETSGLTAGNYIYEFERRDSDGSKPRTVMTGVWIVGNDTRKS